MTRLSVLFISCEFPPDGSPGAIRNVAFAKHLTEHGFNVSVVRELHVPIGHTPKWEFVSKVEIPSAQRRAVHAKPTISRAQTMLSYVTTRLDVSYVGILNLVETVTARHESQPFDLIYASCNPLSAAVAGMRIKNKLGIPLIVEFRDPWLNNPVRVWPTIFHYWWEKRLLRRTLSACDQVIMNTPTARANLLKQLNGRLAEDQIHVIPHSFDADRIHVAETAGRAKGPITLGYSGGFYATARPRSRNMFRRAFSYTPFERSCVDRRLSSPRPLFDAFRQLIDQDESYKSRLCLRFLDSLKPDDISYAKEIGIWKHLILEPRRPPHEISLFLNSCDALYLTNPVFPNLRSPFISTKTVEYIATGKPIVAFLSDSDNRDIARRSGLARLVEPLTVEMLTRTLAELVDDLEQGAALTPDWNYIRRFDRSRHARHLAAVFQQALNIQPKRTITTDCFSTQRAA
jgi:glycosyltransferase involved in cell wall biosynthesis